MFSDSYINDLQLQSGVFDSPQDDDDEDEDEDGPIAA
jgi:hypothetical protein